MASVPSKSQKITLVAGAVVIRLSVPRGASHRLRGRIVYSRPANDNHLLLDADRRYNYQVDVHLREHLRAMRTPPIQAISFDGDGTLWDFNQVMRHALRYALAELQAAAPGLSADLTIEAMIAIRKSVAEELKGTVTNLEAVRLAAFERTLQHIGVADVELADRLNAVYLQHRFADTRPYDDVLPTLDALRGCYRLGLLSNGNSYPDRCGLPERFSFLVFSQDHGIEKPDRRLFEIALTQAGCVPQELLHVGDSLRNDVAGAQGAGVRSVWLNRDSRRNDSAVQPDFEITSLSELPEILDRLSSGTSPTVSQA